MYTSSRPCGGTDVSFGGSTNEDCDPHPPCNLQNLHRISYLRNSRRNASSRWAKKTPPKKQKLHPCHRWWDVSELVTALSVLWVLVEYQIYTHCSTPTKSKKRFPNRFQLVIFQQVVCEMACIAIDATTTATPASRDSFIRFSTTS